ncbi:MAG: hypothetical protein U5K27_02510 [Desulfotignum sp.]|nr:hypothetical protein [Desulfotignum sp.]
MITDFGFKLFTDLVGLFKVFGSSLDSGMDKLKPPGIPTGQSGYLVDQRLFFMIFWIWSRVVKSMDASSSTRMPSDNNSHPARTIKTRSGQPQLVNGNAHKAQSAPRYAQHSRS